MDAREAENEEWRKSEALARLKSLLREAAPALGGAVSEPVIALRRIGDRISLERVIQSARDLRTTPIRPCHGAPFRCSLEPQAH